MIELEEENMDLRKKAEERVDSEVNPKEGIIDESLYRESAVSREERLMKIAKLAKERFSAHRSGLERQSKNLDEILSLAEGKEE
jgi:hypothetical protein